MRSLIRRFPFAAFVVIALGWTWPLAAAVEVSLALPLLGLFGPLVAAAVVVVTTQGTVGLRGLVARFGVRRSQMPWLAASVALPLGLLIPVWLLERWLGSAAELRLAPISLLTLLLAVLIVGEEVGWRGFALPYLLGRWPPILTSLVLGLVWALWHLPNFFLPGFPHQGLPFSAFALTVVAYSVLFTWLYYRTEGNLLVAVIFHAGLNVFAVADIDPVRQQWWRALVYGFLAIAVWAAGAFRNAKNIPEGTVSDQSLEDMRL